MEPTDPTRLLVKTVGILPDSRQGGRTFVKLLHWIFEKSGDYRDITFCLMAENNMAHRLTSKWCGDRKTFGLFAKDL